MNYIFLRGVSAFFVAFISSYHLVPLMVKIAKKWKILDHPDGEIKVHFGQIPYLGGLGVYLGFVAALSLTYNFGADIFWLLLGCTILLFVGLIDDLIVIVPWQKFLGQLIAVVCFLRGGFLLKAGFFSGGFNVIVSGFWMLLIINAFNLVDVMDGLSSIIAIGAALSFLVISLLSGNHPLTLLLLSFLGSIIAFFFYNKPPAVIYLGDSGSLFVGGFLAAIPLLFSWSEYSLYGYLVPVIIMTIPLLEVCFLILIRTSIGIPFYKGSPHHFSIYLLKKGWSKWTILFFCLGLSLVLTLVASLFFLNIITIKTVAFSAMVFFLIWITIVFK